MHECRMFQNAFIHLPVPEPGTEQFFLGDHLYIYMHESLSFNCHFIFVLTTMHADKGDMLCLIRHTHNIMNMHGANIHP